MKGIILAGGSGTRLQPLTKVVNKNLLPVGNVPMIYHPISVLRSAGITEIMIITGTEHMGEMVNALGSGTEFGCEFTYRVQDTPNGIAAALKLCKKFIGNEDKFAVLLGDNIFADDLSDAITSFVNEDSECKIFIKQIHDAERFGVVKFDSDGTVCEIIEKPKNPPSNWAVTGLYLYDAKTVFQIADSLKPSARGEYEISDINCEYAVRKKCTYYKLQGEWVDAGTFASYHKANKLMLEKNENNSW